MPKFDHHFLPLDPPPSSKEELDALETVWSCVVHHPNAVEPVHVRHLGTRHFVRVIAISVPEGERENADLQEWFKQIFETSISALRLSVQPQANPVYGPSGFVTALAQTDDPEPKFSLTMEYHVAPDYQINGRHVGGVFEALFCKSYAAAASLFAESQLHQLPPHYRLLSLVRAVELLYPVPADRTRALQQFEAHFASLNISNRPFNGSLQEIRARCAHGVPNGRRPAKPFVGIGYNNDQLHALVGLLTSMVAHGFRVLHDIPIEGANLLAPDS